MLDLAPDVIFARGADRKITSWNRGAELTCTHHERWDGTGYPRGLAGEAIPNLLDVFFAARAEVEEVRKQYAD